MSEADVGTRERCAEQVKVGRLYEDKRANSAKMKGRLEGGGESPARNYRAKQPHTETSITHQHTQPRRPRPYPCLRAMAVSTPETRIGMTALFEKEL